MKKSPGEACLLIAVAAISSLTFRAVLADDTNSTPVEPVPAPVVRTNTVAIATPQRLPYGVDDVLNLSRAAISDEVIVNYIRNSGTAYMLGPREIVLLRDAGVSDHVITTMLDQRKKVAEDNTQQAVQQATQQAAQQAIQSQDAVAAAPVAPVIYDPSVPPPYASICEPCVEEEEPLLPPRSTSSPTVPPVPLIMVLLITALLTDIRIMAWAIRCTCGAGGSFVYHFGARGGGVVRHGSHGGSVHTTSRR